MTKIALLSFVILVAGCASQEERLWQQDARDDSTCKKSFPHGTESYWKCRSQLDQMRAQQQYAAGPFDMVVRGISAVTGAVGSVR